MDKRVFLATWKDIPAQNEVQYNLENVQHNAGTALMFYYDGDDDRVSMNI